MINPGKHAEALNQIFMSQNLPKDPGIAAVVKSYEKNMDKKFQAQVGTTTVDLDGERGTVRLKELNLANI